MQGLSEEKLKKLEWMLEERDPLSDNERDEYIPPYGDVTKLNSCRLIMDSVGSETLKEIGKYAVKLLDTSVAIYEANGDYAFGMFSSGWCKIMDAASRELCKTDDNREALSCGKWLCHENCWNDSAKRAMETGKPTDIECVGGINLYAEPIYAGQNVIGAINIGYGDPPKSTDKLRVLSDSFDVDPEKIKEIGASYKSRPKFMVDVAKKLLGAFARLIGEIVEKAEAEKTIRKSEEEFRQVYEHMAIGVARVSLDYLIEAANDAYCSMLGYSEKELIGKHLKDITHPEILDENLLKQSQLARGEIDHFRMDKSFIHKNGRVIYGILDANLIRDVDGKPLYFIGSVLDITDRRKAEEKLKESEKKFSTIFESNPAAVAITRLSDNRIVDVNRYWEMATGYARSEVIGHHPHDFDLWADPEAREKLIDQLKEKQKTIVDEVSIHKKSGEIRFFIMSAEIVALFDDNFLITMAQDITDRKQAETKLKHSQNMLKTILDSIPSSVFWKDCDLKYLGGNRLWLDAVGSESSEEIIGRTDYDFPWEKEQADSFRRDDRAVIESGNPRYGIIEAYRKSDGALAWARTNKIPLRDDQGNVIGILGTFEDITDLKEAEDALRESEEKYRLLVEKADEAIFIAQDGIIKFPNPKTLELTGYSEKKLATIPFADLIHPEDRQMVVDRYRRRINGESPPSDYAFRIISKSDSVLWVQNNVAPITWDGRPATINLLRDISEKRQLEKQLRQSQKMEAIATLTGGIAHDYNNLLAIIVGNLGLAQQNAEPGSDQADFLNEAEKAARKVGDLTHELMALSRGGGPIKELGSIRESLKQAIRAVPAERGIAVDESASDDLWLVPHDARKMVGVFRNLVTNAVEAMPDGGVITIKAENLQIVDENGATGPGPKPGRYVHISIQDQGKGMPKEHLNRLFDPYFSTKPMGTQKGMGLGLATAHAIVKKHGGEITVQSTPDVGTTVSIYLPAQSEEGIGQDVEDEVSSSQSSTADQQDLKGRILLMDDEEMLRHLAEQMLKRLGYKVETVKDGTEAIGLYKKHLDSDEPFDAVILDLTIKGGMGGERTLQELLRIDSEIKAIVSSGYFNDPVMTDFENYGFMGTLAKPFEMKDLKESLEKIL